MGTGMLKNYTTVIIVNRHYQSGDTMDCTT